MSSRQRPSVPKDFPPSPLSSISTPLSLSLSSLSTLSPPPTRLFSPHDLSLREEEVFGSPRRRQAATSGPVAASPFTKTAGSRTLLGSPSPRTWSTHFPTAISSPNPTLSPPPRGPTTYSSDSARQFGDNAPGTIVYETTTTVTRTKTTRTRRYDLPPSAPSQAEGFPRHQNFSGRTSAGPPASTRLYGTTSISPSPPQSPCPARTAPHLPPPFTPTAFTPSALLQTTPLAFAATPTPHSSPEPVSANSPAPSAPLVAVRTRTASTATPARSARAAVHQPTPGTPLTPGAPAAATQPRLISWVNRVEKFAPLYEDETDNEDVAPSRVFMIPNPQTMKPPTLTEVGKSVYYVVTCGQEVGVYGSLNEVLVRVEHVPSSSYIARKTWRGAKAVQDRTIRVLPVAGGVFDNP